jgi:bacterioferritin-associated ferredoxin
MYVCICNGIKDSDVRNSVADGAQKVSHVFKKQGCKPECARCVNCIRDIIQEETAPEKFLIAAE